jgi:hypothetical protein
MSAFRESVPVRLGEMRESRKGRGFTGLGRGPVNTVDSWLLHGFATYLGLQRCFSTPDCKTIAPLGNLDHESPRLSDLLNEYAGNRKTRGSTWAK